MKKIVKNKYLDSLLKLMLLSAIIHVVILLIYSITNLNSDKLNFFNIVGIDLLIPALGSGTLNLFIGIIVMLALYILFLKISKKD